MDPGRWADDWERWLPLLERLSLARALSGWEDAVRDVLLRALPPRLPRRADAVGNLLVEAGGGSGPRVMVAAHMDEVGLVVSAVEADGFLRVKAVGGVDPQVLPGRAVRVGDGQGLPGVVAHRPLHLQDRRERQQAVRLEDVRVDVGGLHREEVVSLVPVGAPVTFEPVFAPFGEGRVRGKAFDDRVGCTLVAALLAGGPPLPVVGAFTVQEEIGLRGAGVAARAARPDLAVVVEGTTCADIPGVEGVRRSTMLGAGPALTLVDGSAVPDRWLVRRTAAVAEREGIRFQWKRAAVGGTDAARIQPEAGGIPTMVLSVPCRYIHGPCAVMSLDDFAAALALLRALLHDLAAGGV